MSTTTDRDKVIDQAKALQQLQQALINEMVKGQTLLNEVISARQNNNYIVTELYKLKPDHEIFVKNTALAEDMKKQTAPVAPKAPAGPDGNVLAFPSKEQK
jgi:hypothetical protein